MIKYILIFFLSFFFYNSTAASTKEKIIENFKKINNLSFNFNQTIDGEDERGNCIIKYPKKIYCNYKNNKLLISNGKSLAIINNRSKQYYRYSLENTPLNIILDKKLLINKIKDLPGKKINEKYFNFEIKNKQNIINIYFSNKNYDLIGWQTEDIFQNLAVTFIYDIKINQKINEKIFKLPKMF